MHTRFSLATGLSACAVFASLAHADPVTSVPVSIDQKVVTFSAYDGPLYGSPRAIAPTEVGQAETGVQVQLSFDDDLALNVLGAVSTGFGSNGNWPVDGAFAGLGSASGYMSFTFGSAMNFAGALVNFDALSDLRITVSALNADGDAIQTIVFNDSANPNPPGFYGFTSLGPTADIYGLLFSGGHISVDNLSFGLTQAGTGVPEPASTALVLASLGALVFARRRQQR
jgi:hypothetical protein